MKKIKYLLLALAGLTLAACGNTTTNQDSAQATDVSVGVVGDVSREIWEDVASRLTDEGINLEVRNFNDYIQPNESLASGDLDYNAFQHVAFLAEYVHNSGSDVVPAGYTIVSPSFFFGANGIEKVEDIQDGDIVAISNAPTTAAGTFLALEEMGILNLKDEAELEPTIYDIESYNVNIEIIELEPNQIAISLGDADVISLGADLISDAGFDAKEAIYTYVSEDETKKNVIAVKKENLDSEVTQKIVKAYQSPETEEKIAELSNGTNIPAWSDNDDPMAVFEEALAKLNK